MTHPSDTIDNQRVAQVPKFGDWDRDDDGSSTYTLIFEKIKADRQNNSLKPTDDPAQSDGSIPSIRSTAPVKPPSMDDPPIPTRNPNTMNGSHQNNNHNTDMHSRSHSKSKNHASRYSEDDKSAERKVFRPIHLSNSGHHAPKRSMQSPLSHENPVSFPKFGDWDIKNPQEYTLIFNKLQQEKKDGSFASPMDTSLPTKSARGAPNYEQITPKGQTPSRWCCFGRTPVRE